MLILTRKAGESLHIGDHIIVKVISIQGKQVRLGIIVPDETVVYREEIYSRIVDENRRAMLADSGDLMEVAKQWQGAVK